MTYEDYLQHWGILGMKWGQRNGPPYPLSENKMNASEKKQLSKSKKVKNRPKSLREMTDEELENTLKRLRKEDEYTRLTATKIKQKSEIRKTIEKALLTPTLVGGTWLVGKASKDIAELGYNYVKSFLKEYGNDLLEMIKDVNYNLLEHL